MTSPSSPGTDRPSDGTVRLALLGVAYVVVGGWLYYGIAVGSTTLVLPALAAVLVLVVVSLYVSLRREGVATPENGLISACVAAAMALLVGLPWFTDLPRRVVLGATFVVGVLVPTFVLEFTDYGRDD